MAKSNRPFGSFTDPPKAQKVKNEDNTSFLLSQFTSFSIAATANSASFFSGNAPVLGNSWSYDDMETSSARRGESTSPRARSGTVLTAPPELDDFHSNGRDLELDAYDLCQIRQRSALASVMGEALPTARHQTSDRGSYALRQQTPTCTAPILAPHPPKIPYRKTFPVKGTRHINTVCVFCKKNGETLSFYGGHVLKDSAGRVTCPVLRKYTCPICGDSGDRAHTIKYCPQKVTSLH